MSATEDAREVRPRPRIVAGGVAGVCAAVVAASAFWFAAETHYGECVDAQVAKYPAVAVSAFTTKGTGPVKVAYDQERREAVGKCKRFLFI